MTTEQKHTPMTDDFAVQLSEFNAWRKTQNDGYTAFNAWMEAINRKNFEVDTLAANVKELKAQRDELVMISKSLLYALSVGAKSRNYQSELDDLITKIEAEKQRGTL